MMAVDQDVRPQRFAVLRMAAEDRDDAGHGRIDMADVLVVQLRFLDALPHALLGNGRCRGRRDDLIGPIDIIDVEAVQVGVCFRSARAGIAGTRTNH